MYINFESTCTMVDVYFIPSKIMKHQDQPKKNCIFLQNNAAFNTDKLYEYKNTQHQLFMNIHIFKNNKKKMMG